MARGSAGAHITAQVGPLHLGLTIKDEEPVRGTVDLDVDLAQCPSAREARRHLDVLESMTSPNRLDVDFSVARGALHFPQGGAWAADYLTETRRLVDDLVTVEEGLDIVLPVPEQIDAKELRELRRAALLLRGHVAVFLRGSLKATLNGEDSPVLRNYLNERKPGTLLVHTTVALELAGRNLELGQVAIYNRHSLLTAPPEAVAALKRGQAAGLQIEASSPVGDPWLIYRTDDIANVDLSRRATDEEEAAA